MPSFKSVEKYFKRVLYLYKRFIPNRTVTEDYVAFAKISNIQYISATEVEVLVAIVCKTNTAQAAELPLPKFRIRANSSAVCFIELDVSPKRKKHAKLMYEILRDRQSAVP